MPIQVVSAEFVKTATRQEEAARRHPGARVRRPIERRQVLDAERAHPQEGARARVGNAGRTRALQFFDIGYRPTPKARPRSARFCDLPGYGYAKVSREERDRWAAMIEDYLRGRDVLRRWSSSSTRAIRPPRATSMPPRSCAPPAGAWSWRRRRWTSSRGRGAARRSGR